MNTSELLVELARLGIRLSAAGDQLAIHAPKGVITPTLQTRLSEHKTEILALLQRANGEGDDLLLPQILPDPAHRNLPFPLTDIQQAYLIGRTAAFEMGNVSIHFYVELDCVGLDLERLCLAWRKLVDRHDMLRAIVLPDGLQQVLEQVPAYEIGVSDQRGKGHQVAASVLEETRQRMSHQVLPFDRWPLFEIVATRYDDERLRLHLSIDGLYIDGGSLMILFHEWAQLYKNIDTPLKPLQLSYRDHVLADVAMRNTELYQRSLGYWRKRVAVLPPAPELPLIKNPASLTEPKFSHRSGRLDPETWLRLKTQATKLGLSPSAVLLAAYAEVLAVWSRHPHFTINVTLFNRFFRHPQVNDILGNFTSLILLEVDNTKLDRLEIRARRLQKQLWSDLEYRYVSGVHALRELARVKRRTSGSVMPIVFTSLLNLGPQGFRSPLTTLSELGEIVYVITQTPQVWLDNQVFEDSGALVFNWDAVDELFPAELLDDMFAAYHRLLKSLADERNWQSTQFQLVPNAQLEQRAAVNATAGSVPKELLQTLFEQQALQRPDQPAVITSKFTLTYQELNRRANQLGHRLRELGVKPNTLVAIVMEKGWEQVVSVLGVIKAGGAYIPVEANFPKERQHSLIEDSEARVILTQSWINEKLEWPQGVRRICVDRDDLSGLAESSPEPVQQQEDLAYVLYTSGSTGKPKGVMIEQRSVINRMVDVANRFQLGPEDRSIALTPLHHDLSVFDIFGMLCVVGGSIVLPDAEGVRDPTHWADLMIKERVTVWNSVPTFMQMLTEYLENAPSQKVVVPVLLRLVILSGDFIPVDLPDRIRHLIKGVNVVSAGGPTETTVWDICYSIGEVDPEWKSIPYGRPMANAEYHVLNDKLEPRPVWVPGELFIAGVGTARGYWRDEERTGAGFITHPQTGQRLYRSGDMGRYLPDGNIEILGRDDLQIKIRGQRIELGEIEVTLAQHPAVRAAVVSVVGEEHEDQRIVAYVVPQQVRVSPGHESQNATDEEERPQDHDAAYQLKGVIDDPIERLEFKLKEVGLRQQDPDSAQIRLSKPDLDDALIKRYRERQSYRAFILEPIAFEHFSEFLSHLLQIKTDTSPLPKYRYPSAGGLYPVQIYLYIKPGRVEGIGGGTYYYHPKDHRLVLLTADASIKRNVHVPTNQSVFDESAFSLFLIGQMSAIAPMYGELSRDFSLLEAGYIGQLLMTSARASQIGLCPIGGLDFPRIRGLFELSENHVLLHSLVGGRIDIGDLPHPAPALNATTRSAPTSPQPRADGTLIGNLRSFLQAKLPEHMVPSSFIVMEALPLTSNGKVDRSALPSPEDRPDSKKSYVAPRTDIEQTLATILQEVLQLQTVGIQDNFFDLGASSLHMVQVHSKLQTALNRDISMKEMFKYPTVSLFAEYLSQQQPTDQPSFQRIHEQARKQLEAIKRQKHRLREKENE